MKYAAVLAVVLAQAAAANDAFPEPSDSQQGDAAPLAAVEAAAALAVPEGFRVELLAAEPTLRNPIAVSQDARRDKRTKKNVRINSNHSNRSKEYNKHKTRIC